MANGRSWWLRSVGGATIARPVVPRVSVRVGHRLGPVRRRRPLARSRFFAPRRVDRGARLRLDLALGLGDARAGRLRSSALAAVAARTRQPQARDERPRARLRAIPCCSPRSLPRSMRCPRAGCCPPSVSASTPSRRPAAIGVARSERAARTEEAIEIVRLLWGGGPVTYSGRFASLDGRHALAGADPPGARHLARRIEPGGAAADGEDRRRLDRLVRVTRRAHRLRRSGSSRRRPTQGATIDDDHYGTTLFAAPSLDELPPQARSLLSLRPDLAFDDHVAIGTAALHALIERFVEAGASKFVVVPIADDIHVLARARSASRRSSSWSSRA